MVKQIFEISDDAAKQINVAAEESESSKWPLRISLNVDSSGKLTPLHQHVYFQPLFLWVEEKLLYDYW